MKNTKFSSRDKVVHNGILYEFGWYHDGNKQASIFEEDFPHKWTYVDVVDLEAASLPTPKQLRDEQLAYAGLSSNDFKDPQKAQRCADHIKAQREELHGITNNFLYKQWKASMEAGGIHIDGFNPPAGTSWNDFTAIIGRGLSKEQ